MSESIDKIRAFIIENFLFGNTDGIRDNLSFLEEGIIDSTGVLELVTYLEDEFSIKVNDDELIPENLDSINAISAFLQKKLARRASLTSRNEMSAIPAELR